MLVPDRGQETHTFRVSYATHATLRVLGGLTSLAALALTLIAGSWWYLASRASRVADLESELAALQADRIRLGSLARQLEGLEQPASTLPTSWPLSDRGFVTQGLLEGADGDHPGLDIAVPTDSYVRAAGAGSVVDLGEDPVYGRFVVIDHGDGYSTRYAHASLQLVTLGQVVRQNEVIALSGSTGRSTAPHLHFEILLDGQAVDPFTLVTQP
jgi:murein DD-endopeptidase MepM/ murein hydrolase activator NlpD